MTSRFRPALRALTAPGLAVVIGLLLLGLLAPAAAQPRPPRPLPEPDDVFTATIERIEREPSPDGRPTRYTYTVLVQEVFGESDIASVRVRVQTSAEYGDCATRPDSRGPDLFVWKLFRQGTQLVATGCRSVLRATDARVAETVTEFGEPRSPIDSTPSEPPVEFPEVTYTCPETTEAITDVAAAVETCDEVAAPQAFDRAAAPGLALILVGVLGWIVILRVGRTRR